MSGQTTTATCEICENECPVDAMTHYDESAISQCHKCEDEHQRWATWYFTGKIDKERAQCTRA